MNFRKIALVVFSISFVWVLMFGGFSKEAEADDANLVLWHNYGNGGGFGTNSEAGNSKNVNDLVTKNNGLVRKMDYNSLIDNRGQVCNNPPPGIAKTCVDPDSNPGNCIFHGKGLDCGWTRKISGFKSLFDRAEEKERTHHVMAGFSLGGAAAAYIATDPANKDISFSVLWLVDPVGQGIERRGVFKTCAFIPFESRIPTTLCTSTGERIFPINVKNIVLRYQKSGVFPNDFSFVPDIHRADPNATPVDESFITCDNPGACHMTVGDDKDNNNGYRDVYDILIQMNNFPTIQTVDTEINELDIINVTVSDILTRYESGGKAKNTFRYFHDEQVRIQNFNPIETVAKVPFGEPGGLPSNQLDGEKIPTKYEMIFNVYDNGFPCGDCTDNGGNQANSLNSKGAWHKKEVTLTVTNSPPIPSVKLITPSEVSTASALEEETCLPKTGANIIQSPNIIIDVSVLDSIPDMDAGMNYTVNWGDGTIDDVNMTDSDIPIIFSHTVSKVGDSTITVFAKDKDDGIGNKTMIVHLPDADCDGIQDLVDTIPDEFSDDAEDETNFVGMTNGTIIDRGNQEVSIIDAYYPGTTLSCPDSSVRTFNFTSNMCEDPERICTDGIFNEETSKCEQDPHFSPPADPLCFVDNDNPGESIFLEYNDETKLCEADPLCKKDSSFTFNLESRQCESPPICPPDSTFDSERDQCVANSAFDDPPPGISIGAFTTSDGTITFSISEDNQVVVQVLEQDPGAPAEISVCGASALLRIVSGDIAIVTCSSVTIEGISGTVEVDFQVGCRTHTAFVNAGQILKFDPETLEYTNLGTTDITIKGGTPSLLLAGETRSAGSVCGGESHEPPTIGKNLAGTKQMVNNGFCIDADCFTVTKLFHEEFKLYEMMSGTHTLSTLIYCAQGVGHCNYSAIGIMPYDKDMNDAVWKIEMKGNHLGEWTPVIFDPEGFLGEVTITTQIVNDKFLSVSYTIEFKNKQTPPMKVGVQLRDDKHGVRNFYFNEGIRFNDSDAYPYVETAFETPIKVEKLCINPQPHDRDSCGFELVRDWTQKKAQDLLNDMQNGNYIYDKYVRDRYYD